MDAANVLHSAVKVAVDGVTLDGDLRLPRGAKGIVLFAHGSGSSRLSPRNQYVAGELHKANIGTLLFDLLTPQEEYRERYTRHLRFDIEMLARRLAGATDWLRQNHTEIASFKVGFFGASTGGGAALVASTMLPDGLVSAVVSRGGRPDLAGDALRHVKAATLLIVGGNDEPVITMNRTAYRAMSCEKRLDIVPGATHLFEEPGTLEEVARLAREWFATHLS